MVKLKADRQPLSTVFATRFLDLFGVSPTEPLSSQRSSSFPSKNQSSQSHLSISWDNRSVKSPTLTPKIEATPLDETFKLRDITNASQVHQCSPKLENVVKLEPRKKQPIVDQMSSTEKPNITYQPESDSIKDEIISSNLLQVSKNIPRTNSLKSFERKVNIKESPETLGANWATLSTNGSTSSDTNSEHLVKQEKVSVLSENTKTIEIADVQSIPPVQSGSQQTNKYTQTKLSDTNWNDFVKFESVRSTSTTDLPDRLGILAQLPLALTIGCWTRYQDDQGQLYYYNSEEETTQWEAPEDFKSYLKDRALSNFKEKNQHLREENDILYQEQESLLREIYQLKVSTEKLMKNHMKIMVENARLHLIQKMTRNKDHIISDDESEKSRVKTDMSSLPSKNPEMVETLNGEQGALDSSRLYKSEGSDVGSFLINSIKSKIKRVFTGTTLSEQNPVKIKKFSNSRSVDKTDNNQVQSTKGRDQKDDGWKRKTRKRKRKPRYSPMRILNTSNFRKRRRFGNKCRYGASCIYQNCKFQHPKIKLKRNLPTFLELKHECDECGQRFRFRDSLKVHLKEHRRRSKSSKRRLPEKSTEKEIEQVDMKLSKVSTVVEGNCKSNQDLSSNDKVLANDEEKDRRSKRRKKLGRKKYPESGTS